MSEMFFTFWITLVYSEYNLLQLPSMFSCPCSCLILYHCTFAASLSVLMAGTSYGWINPLLPRLLKVNSELPLSPGQGSWVVALIELGDLFSPLPAAKLVDTLGRKPLLLFTAPLYLISWILVLYTRSIPVLYFVRSVWAYYCWHLIHNVRGYYII